MKSLFADTDYDIPVTQFSSDQLRTMITTGIMRYDDDSHEGVEIRRVLPETTVQLSVCLRSARGKKKVPSASYLGNGPALLRRLQDRVHLRLFKSSVHIANAEYRIRDNTIVIEESIQAEIRLTVCHPDFRPHSEHEESAGLSIRELFQQSEHGSSRS